MTEHISSLPAGLRTSSPPHRPRHPDRPAARRCFLASGILVLLLAAVASVFLWTPGGQQLDQQLMRHLAQAGGAVAALGDLVASTGAFAVPQVLGAIALACFEAVRRRRSTPLLMVVAVVAGSNVTTQVLKTLLPRPELLAPGTSFGNSFPSGHATLVMSAVVAVLLLLPRLVCVLVAGPLAVLVAATCTGIVAAGWHRPSDIVGAAIIVGVWALAVRGGVLVRHGNRPVSVR